MPKFDRAVFFGKVRHGPFAGRLTPEQVQGMNDLLDAFLAVGTTDLRFIAYGFATNYRETGGRMQPVRETFATSDARARKGVARRAYGKPEGPWGHVYYGRGDVQLSWYRNYVVMGRILGIPLAQNPDLALESKTSKRILVEGMTRGKSSKGDFTGKSLEDYFNATTDDPVGARRIVNGTDVAALIAGYHKQFLAALEAARLPEASGWGSSVASMFTAILKYLNRKGS